MPQLKSVETTPNPNSMKLNLDVPVAGKPATFSSQQRSDCPQNLTGLLDIEGVASIFVCHDFITVNRDPRADWKPILEAATKQLSAPAESSQPEAIALQKPESSADGEGQVSILVQTFRGIPIQVKALSAHSEKRISTGARFNQAAQKVHNESGADYLAERYWADWGVRYGLLDQVAQEVFDEIDGTMNDESLQRLVDQALGKDKTDAVSVVKSPTELRHELEAPDWQTRLKAVQDIGTSEHAIALLSVALHDAHPQVRRLAAAALGASGNPQAVAPLTEALIADQSVAVRRTAGDALSDLGDAAAQPAICQALQDKNKLVRWRAARFLCEVGTPEALSHLSNAACDPEFEVRLEIEAAIERIQGGMAPSLPAWKRIVDGS